MKNDIERVSKDIVMLLNITNRVIDIEELNYYLDEPYYLINFSLTYLIRKNAVKVIKEKGKLKVLKINDSNVCFCA